MDADKAAELGLTCPICFEMYLGKWIFQCENGHAFCNDCFDKLFGSLEGRPRKCPTCSIKIPKQIRNLALEQAAELCANFFTKEQEEEKAKNNPRKRKRSESPEPNPTAIANFHSHSHDRIFCDVCKANTTVYDEAIEGFRYRCMNCDNFNLCAGCFNMKTHDKNHKFLRIRLLF